MHVSRPAVVALVLMLVACSGSDDAEPPPATRQIVDGVATELAGSDELFTRSETTDAEASDGEGLVVPVDSTGRPEEIAVDSPTSAPGAPGTAAPGSDPAAGDDPEGSPPADTVPPIDYSIVFEDLGDGVEGGWLTVPVDYDDPTGDTLELWVTRHLADSDDRVGVLLTNNGGPGVAASSMALNAGLYFEDPLLKYFDIVSWDPRGTGVSGGSVDCIEDEEYDRFFGASDITPDDEAERQALVDLSREFAERCIDATGDLLAHIGTNNSARDMDAIRQALGEVQASYLGFSYGSELGAVWATLFPETVRAVVLDGAGHPDPGGVEPSKQQQLGFEQAFDTFLAQCSDNSSCAFHNEGDAEGAYDRLLERVDAEPVVVDPDRVAVNQEVLTGAVIQAMYTDRRWPALERSLADATAGDGAGILALFDGYYQRAQDGSYTNLLESFQAITCADQEERLSPDEADRRADELIGISPRVFPGTTGAYVCGFFPPSDDPRLEITGERAGPIVVIGTTGDPSTTLDSSAAMADALEDGILVTVEANQHTSYRSSDCINEIVHQDLIWLEPPEPDTRCP